MLAVLNTLALGAAAGFFLALHAACYGLGVVGIERMLAAYTPAAWVIVTIAVVLEVGKASLAYGAGATFRAGSYMSAAIMGLLAALCVFFSALSDFGSATHGLAENGRRGQSQMDTRTGLLSELRAAEAQREAMSRPAPPRPSTAIEAAMAGTSVPAWALRDTSGCKDVLTEVALIRACRPMTSLLVEHAQATAYEKLTERIDTLRARVEALDVVATKDPVARVVEAITQKAGLDLSGADTFSLLVVLLLQLGTVTGSSLTAAMYRSMFVPPTTQALVAEAKQVVEVVASAQVDDTTTPSVQVAEAAAVQPAIAQTPPHTARSSAGWGAPVRAARSAAALAPTSAGLPTNVVQLSPLKSQAKCRSTGAVETATDGALAVQVAHSPAPSSGSASGAPTSSGQPGSSGDDVQVFVQVAIKPRRGAEVASGEIQAAYSEWCRSTGRPMVSPVSLGIRLAQLGLKKRRSNSRTSYLDVELVV